MITVTVNKFPHANAGFGFLHKRLNKIQLDAIDHTEVDLQVRPLKNTRYRGIYYFTLLITTPHINALKYSLKFVLKSRRSSTSFFSAQAKIDFK